MSPTGPTERRLLPGRFATFGLLYAFWLVFSGHYDAFHLGLGFLCAGLVAYTSHDLLLPDVITRGDLVTVWRFTLYIPWLIYQIVLANLHVVYLVFNMKHVDPRIVRFHTKLESELARVTLANSITLTPGTITMDLVDREFQVHAISRKVAEDLETGEMEKRVAQVFLEMHDE
jgi:multicomponent Na+:H+ antiporter subunit E